LDGRGYSKLIILKKKTEILSPLFLSGVRSDGTRFTTIDNSDDSLCDRRRAEEIRHYEASFNSSALGEWTVQYIAREQETPNRKGKSTINIVLQIKYGKQIYINIQIRPVPINCLPM